MDSKDFSTYITSRGKYWIDDIVYYSGEYWFNDEGVMYKISVKESSTQFPVCYLIARRVFANMNTEEHEYLDVQEILTDRQEMIDCKDFVYQIFKRIIDKEQRAAANEYERKQHFKNRTDDHIELGLWLKPHPYIVRYLKPETLSTRCREVCCIDSILVDNLDWEDKEPPSNFRKLCYNVFGVKYEDEYYELLAVFSKSLQRTRGGQYFVSVKGKGGSGKSTFVALMCQIFDGLICEITEDAFSTRVSGYDFILEKRKMNRASTILIDESNERQKDNNLIKRITSGTSVPYREISTNGGTLQVCASVVYFSNNPIVINDIDSGTVRRMIEYESPEKTLEIAWDRNTNFLDVFQPERNKIIVDFIKSFRYKPKPKRTDKAVQTSYSEYMKIFMIDKDNPLAILPVKDVNDKLRRNFGVLPIATRKLIDQQLLRQGVVKKNVNRKGFENCYCYVGLDWAMPDHDFCFGELDPFLLPTKIK